MCISVNGRETKREREKACVLAAIPQTRLLNVSECHTNMELVQYTHCNRAAPINSVSDCTEAFAQEGILCLFSQGDQEALLQDIAATV